MLLGGNLLLPVKVNPEQVEVFSEKSLYIIVSY